MGTPINVFGEHWDVISRGLGNIIATRPPDATSERDNAVVETVELLSKSSTHFATAAGVVIMAAENIPEVAITLFQALLPVALRMRMESMFAEGDEVIAPRPVA